MQIRLGKFQKTLSKEILKFLTSLPMIGIIPPHKTCSFCQSKIKESNKMLKVKCKKLQQIYFINQDNNLV